MKQTVSYFSAGTGEQAVPLHVGLLFDTSESMERGHAVFSKRRDSIPEYIPKSARFHVRGVCRRSPGRTLFSVRVSAAGRADSQQQGEGSHGAVRRRQRLSGQRFRSDGQKVLVLYTDGGDTSSSRTWDQTIRLLRTSDVTVYPVGFLASRGSARLMQQSQLMEMARLTGGRAVFPGTMKGSRADVQPKLRRRFTHNTCSDMCRLIRCATESGARWRFDSSARRPNVYRFEPARDTLLQCMNPVTFRVMKPDQFRRIALSLEGAVEGCTHGPSRLSSQQPDICLAPFEESIRNGEAHTG